MLDRDDSAVRLLVPTATMAEHLRHQLARERGVLRPSLVQTLSQFVNERTRDLPQVSGPQMNLVVEQVVARLGRAEFARVAELPGFVAALVSTIEEFSTAGCDSRRLAQNLPRTTLAPPFLEVYRAVEEELARRGVWMRPAKLERAAHRIREGGLGAVHSVILEGFFTLSDPEQQVVDAIRRHADVTVAPPGMRVATATQVVSAPGPAQEADEIARRILAESAAGRVFRDIGIVVRNPDLYVPILRASLGRFGIPARFYFTQKLAEHPVIEYLGGLVTAMLGGWEHDATLAALKHSGIGDRWDQFEFAVLARLPAQGLDELAALADGDAALVELIRQLRTLESWRGASLTPRDWVMRLSKLRTLWRPERSLAASHEAASLWRAYAVALEAFTAPLEEAAACFDSGRRLPLGEFWKVASAALRLTPLRVPDRRRDVVHVMSVYEARQWELPVVFVCGLAEKEFPRHHVEEPFFPDHARRELAQAGIRVRTAAVSEQEEAFLFELASTRATDSLILSYPETDLRGEANLPSVFLERVSAAHSASTAAVRPRPVCAAGAPGPVRIESGELLAEKHRSVSPSGLECFVDCPFQFFMRHTLRLETRPPRPEDRFDFLLQGSIVHTVLAEVQGRPHELDAVFARIFDQECTKASVPRGYRAEALRRQMLDDVRRLLEDDQLPRASEVRTEQKFRFTLEGGATVRGRIDRIDLWEDGRALILDYKYSAAQRVMDRAR
ncbi:MAG: PD-(D/E)XK nuclease family protein, partial [Bryobacteraceae bacterium]